MVVHRCEQESVTELQVASKARRSDVGGVSWRSLVPRFCSENRISLSYLPLTLRSHGETMSTTQSHVFQHAHPLTVSTTSHAQ